MENEPPRRRVRRAKQSRPVAPGFASHPPEAERHAASPPGEVAVAADPDDRAGPGGDANETAAVAEPVVPPALAVDDQEWEPETLPASSRDGAWLPAGITVLVMVSLLVCAGLVLIASQQ